ncbi:hypothetical protein DL766_002281 [Monosporascus sp. MC13-8B]|uniref:protein S-acyltransferase n=1 Tax=Monosporascus cannonballus TaxID=155416 RepID=A0ABY0HK25_9PEZI|nr:hypothetical protein DL762_000178 [Monosporascus cannonballus]RYO97317.1 hypothetical protein DL763_002777 [Monosporascus cannonballus]RYP35880.1 hypothetical protein DL766_002281 [Monosporascus sp. MC13-8B]
MRMVGRRSRGLYKKGKHRSHKAVAKLLVEKVLMWTPKTKNGRTPLLLAAKQRHTTVFFQLLEQGADRELKNEDGQRSLLWASVSGHGVVVKWLLENGADITMKDKESSRTLLEWAEWKEHWGILQQLLESGTNSGSRTRNMINCSYSLLAEDGRYDKVSLWAAEYGHAAAVQRLPEKGADLDCRVERKRTSLSWATQ